MREGEEQRDHARDDADDERSPLDDFDDRRGREIELRCGYRAHSVPFPAFAGLVVCGRVCGKVRGKVAPVPGSVNSGAFEGTLCPVGTSAEVAFWLNCSARM